MSSPAYVTEPGQLAELAQAVAASPVVALDTEFHRERTYFPQLALLQIAYDGGLALVDPLAVDVTPLGPALEAPLVVLHAAQQDLEVLARSCGRVPRRIFDTQLAACFLGHATPSLGNLLSAELQVRLPKADRLTDWLKRPLTDDQLAYAASDVAHLHDLHAHLVARLDAVGRRSWAEAEFVELLARPVGPADPELAWLRLKDHRSLKGTSRGVAQCVAAWRERRAVQLDQPTRFVLSDLAILGIAQRPPTSLDQLKAVRGLDDRYARGTLGAELLAAINEGLALPAEHLRLPQTDEVERTLRPAVTLVSAWVSQLARDQKIDTSLLATRADLVSLLHRDPTSRLAHGWRAEVLGDDVRRLVDGEAALAFDGKGNLVLEPRAST